MSGILITGATGNTGRAVIRHLFRAKTGDTIIAGVRNVESAKNSFKHYPELQYVHFDFENPATFDDALAGIGRIFLLRPPHLSQVDRYFRPLIAKICQKNIRQIVFLSVQGAEKSRVIPHHKIERLIRGYGLDYIFLRPGYFMQNLTTTLLADIQATREIILPAGNARFNWIDVENIGEAGAMLLGNFEAYKNRAFDLTGAEKMNFEQVSTLINRIVTPPVTYRNVSPARFFSIKRREGMKKELILVMLLLHFLPRFQREPKISDFYERLTGKAPTDLKTFISREKIQFESRASEPA